MLKSSIQTKVFYSRLDCILTIHFLEEEEIPGLGFQGEPDDRLPMPANSWEPLAQDPYNRPVPRTG